MIQKKLTGADVVITDTWASMGMESEKEVLSKSFFPAIRSMPN